MVARRREPEATDATMRASDGDREWAAEILREQTAQGRLTIDEFEQPVEVAYGAKIRAELRWLIRDLP